MSSCRHRHGPWCCEYDYSYPDYPPAVYPIPTYPAPAYPPSRPRRGRRPQMEDLEVHLAELEIELARVRRELAAHQREEEDA